MDLRAGRAPASAVYETAASLPMLEESVAAKWRRAEVLPLSDEMSPHALAPRLPTLGISPPWKSACTELVEVVLARGNAPRSIGYQPIALLLSYARVMGNWRRAEVLRPKRQSRSVCFRNSACALAGSLSTKKWRRAVVLPHRPCGPSRLPTGRRATRLYSPTKQLSGGERSRSPAAQGRPSRFKRVPAPRPVWPPKVSAAGGAHNVCEAAHQQVRGKTPSFASEKRVNCTCVDPLRRRRPELLGCAE